MRRAKKVIRYEQRRSFTHDKVADNQNGSKQNQLSQKAYFASQNAI